MRFLGYLHLTSQKLCVYLAAYKKAHFFLTPHALLKLTHWNFTTMFGVIKLESVSYRAIVSLILYV